ncbi:hypothetical protein ANCDUO_27157, partial [Ancylostoma duodenale]
NYPEDIPGSFESYLQMLDELSPRKGSMRCCLPPSMLAVFHPYVLDLNRHQWRQLLDGEELGIRVKGQQFSGSHLLGWRKRNMPSHFVIWVLEKGTNLGREPIV